MDFFNYPPSFVVQVLELVNKESLFVKPNRGLSFPFVVVVKELLNKKENELYKGRFESMLKYCGNQTDGEEIKDYVEVVFQKFIMNRHNQFITAVEKREKEFICPLSQEIFKNPVLLKETNLFFEKRPLHEYLLEKKTCPQTKAKLSVPENEDSRNPQSYYIRMPEFEKKLDDFRSWGLSEGIEIIREMMKFDESFHKKEFEKQVIHILKHLIHLFPDDLRLHKFHFRMRKKMKIKKKKLHSMEIDLLKRMYDLKHYKSFSSFCDKLKKNIEDEEGGGYSEKQRIEYYERKYALNEKRRNKSELAEILDKLSHLYDDLTEGDTEGLIIQKMIPMQFKLNELTKELEEKDEAMEKLSIQNQELMKRLEKIEKYQEEQKGMKINSGGMDFKLVLEEQDEQIRRLQQTQIMLLSENGPLMYEQAQNRMRKLEHIELKMVVDENNKAGVIFSELFPLGSLPWTFAFYPRGKTMKGKSTDFVLISMINELEIKADVEVKLLNEKGFEKKVSKQIFAPSWEVNSFCPMNSRRDVWRFRIEILVFSIEKKNSKKKI